MVYIVVSNGQDFDEHDMSLKGCI